MPGRSCVPIRLLCILSIALIHHSTFAASLVVVPNLDQNHEGSEDSAYPFNISDPGSGNPVPNLRYQQIYAAGQFSSVVGPQLITRISFRPDSVAGHAFSWTLNNIQIRLSTSTRAVNNLSLTFADNVGSNDTVVHDGALPLSSQALGPAPKPFDIVINLQTPFVYDPQLGNLLMDVRNFSGGLTTFFDASLRASPITIAWVGGPVAATTAQFGNVGFGLVTQWTMAPVPEPAFGIPLAALLLAGMRIRKPTRMHLTDS